jgi:Spy/CpxP family protein refolding chaperone
MKFGKKGKISAAVALLSIAAIAGHIQPTIAGTPSGAPLVDKEFESALRKFVSKRFFNRIEASPEQREKISKIMADTQEQTRPDREQLRQGVLELSSMMSNEKTNDEEIKKRVNDLRALKQKIGDQRLTAALQVRHILTAEQRQKIHNRISEFITGGMSPRKLGMMHKHLSLLSQTENTVEDADTVLAPKASGAF